MVSAKIDNVVPLSDLMDVDQTKVRELMENPLFKAYEGFLYLDTIFSSHAFDLSQEFLSEVKATYTGCHLEVSNAIIDKLDRAGFSGTLLSAAFYIAKGMARFDK